ncbi:hypothetical protein [Rhodococcus qingshengii]|uniref:hypothetical protein n=1 Tax=Rhodococcus qingshengii TaxID=334542 RepID=UPI0018DAE6B5|nr:hypothetical protein [Rhodococcus qingshengii]QPG87579.1 hypothetical protein I1G86_17115 [Rhodococcus qingshengii]
MAIYDEDPRPRVLITGASTDASELVKVVEQYSGVVHVVGAHEHAIRWESWDAVVSVGSSNRSEEHLFILQLGGAPIGRWDSGYPNSPAGRFREIRLWSSYGKELETNDELDASLRTLVKSDLLPLLRQRSDTRRVIHTPNFDLEGSYFIPLVSDLDGRADAAIYRPDQGPQEVIYLPDTVTDIRPWLLYAFERWAAVDPVTFPAGPDWADNPEWMTAEEADARATWVAACDAAEKARIEEERVERESLSALGELREKVDEAERVLLTGTAEELVQAVRSALIRIGFVVEDQDALGAREKLEDLRVHDGEWIALCEVKGYTGGGKVADLLKIGRFVERYMKETKGESPDARWYVVNQFRERDPSTRKQLLWGQDADVEGFAESDGLAIDTRSIFLLDKDVAGGVVTSDEARRLLRDSTGRFAYGL